MKPALKTQRLTLEPFMVTDLALLHEMFTEPFVRKYLWDDEIISIDHTRDIIELNDQNFKQKNWGLWKIINKSDKACCGFAGLWEFFDEPQPQLLFGLLPSKTGLGYATEAAEAILHYAFTSLRFTYLTASFDSLNLSSEKVCQRLQMVKAEDREMNNKMTTFYQIESP